MLKYCLSENSLTNEVTSYLAQVYCQENKKLDDIISYMIAEDTGLTRPQAMAYFEKLTQAVLHFAGEGHSISTPLFQVRPTITG